MHYQKALGNAAKSTFRALSFTRTESNWYKKSKKFYNHYVCSLGTDLQIELVQRAISYLSKVTICPSENHRFSVLNNYTHLRILRLSPLSEKLVTINVSSQLLSHIGEQLR